MLPPPAMSHAPRRDPTRVEAAIRLAAAAHEGQTRKDGRTPYLVHPLAVLRILSSDLGVTDPDILSAAVLHDVLEDTSTSRETLRAGFGDRVLGLVEELTIPLEFHGPTVRDAQKNELAVRAIGELTWEAVLIKLCDRWDNLRDASNAVWDLAKRTSYAEGTRALLGRLEHRVAKGPPPERLALPLAQAAAGLERLVDDLPSQSRAPARGSGS